MRSHGLTHGVVSGSLGTGNLGDTELLGAFLKRHGHDYESITVVADGPAITSEDKMHVVKLPQFPLGRRWWRGFWDRRATRRTILQQGKDLRREYVWLGGLLGADDLHNKLRERELEWSKQFCDRLVYYFGDVADGFAGSPVAPRLIRSLHEADSWIAVRSREAAGVLEAAGYGKAVRVGVDPVLFDRATDRGLPFERRAAASATMAIVPCIYHRDQAMDIWLEAALAGIREGLDIHWISFSDREDLALCRELAARTNVRNPQHIQQVVPSYDAEARLDEAACCVATRYHSLILSLCSGIPTIGIPYDVKISRLMELLDLGQLVARQSNLASRPDLESWFSDRVRTLCSASWAPDYSKLTPMLESHARALEELTNPRAGTEETAAGRDRPGAG